MFKSSWAPDPDFAIHTPRLTIIHFLPESDLHCQCLVDLNTDGAPGLSDITTIAAAREHMHTRIKTIHATDGHGPFCVATRDGVPVGMVSLVRTRPEWPATAYMPVPDVGFGFMKKETGKGFATEAARALLKYAQAHWGVAGVLGITGTDNEGAKRVLKKIGLESRGAKVFRLFPTHSVAVYASVGLEIDFSEFCLENESVHESK